MSMEKKEKQERHAKGEERRERKIDQTEDIQLASQKALRSQLDNIASNRKEANANRKIETQQEGSNKDETWMDPQRHPLIDALVGGKRRCQFGRHHRHRQAVAEHTRSVVGKASRKWTGMFHVQQACSNGDVRR